MKKYRIYFLIFISVACLAAFLKKMISTQDYSTLIHPEEDCIFHGDYLPVVDLLQKTEDTYQLDSIDATRFVYSASFCDLGKIRKDVKALDSIFENSAQGRDIYISLLTDQLLSRVENSGIHRNIDSLIALSQWVNRFDNIKDTDPVNGKTYKIVYRFWMNYISNQLGRLVEESPDLKYQFKFRYLNAFCQSKKYFPPIGNTKIEKLSNYLTENQCGYILNRLWFGTGGLSKVVILALIMVTLYGYLCIFKIHFKKKSDA
jgi:hypothetical protein